MADSTTVTDRLDQARACLESGNFSGAEKAAMSALEAAPKDEAVRFVLATAKLRLGDLEGASRWAAKGIRNNPRGQDALAFQAEFFWRTGRAAEALRLAEEKAALHPDDALGWNDLGFMNGAVGRQDRAAVCFARAVALRPAFAPFHQNLGGAFAGLDRAWDAITAFKQALALGGSSFELLANISTQLLGVGEIDEAGMYCRMAHDLEPRSARGMIEGAKACIYKGESLEVAEHLLREALRQEPDNAATYGQLGFVLQKLGMFEEARECLLKAIELSPNRPGPYADILGAKKLTSADLPMVERLASLVAGQGITAHERRMVNLSLGKAYDQLGEYEAAMASCDEAHRISREVLARQFDRTAFSEDNSLQVRMFDGDPVEATFASESSMPIFIVGMMRSGTTLVEQILSSHPKVAAGGEQGFWSHHFAEAIDRDRLSIRPARSAELITEYVAILTRLSQGKPRVTDKLPDNYRILGLLHSLFPRAKFIHCRRDPVDTSISIYMQPFISPPAYVHDKADLVFVYREYLRLMEHWRRILPPAALFEVDYEAMVEDQARVTREMLAFCGLNWDDACLRPEANRRAVLTASHWQVRQPVYSSSIGRGKHYESWLGPLKELTDGFDG